MGLRVLIGLRDGADFLQLFYNLVWGGERLTYELRGPPENLPTISKSADLFEKVL